MAVNVSSPLQGESLCRTCFGMPTGGGVNKNSSKTNHPDLRPPLLKTRRGFLITTRQCAFGLPFTREGINAEGSPTKPYTLIVYKILTNKELKNRDICSYSFHFKTRNFRLLFSPCAALKFITVATAMPINFALPSEKIDCPYSTGFQNGMSIITDPLN